MALVSTASRLTGKSVPALLEDFGRKVAPDLLEMYVIDMRPDWKTLDVLENTESRIHMLARQRDGAEPPTLDCRRNGNSVSIRYESKRKMCALGKGLIQGIADYYKEPITLRETTCMTRGDACCQFEVTLRE